MAVNPGQHHERQLVLGFARLKIKLRGASVEKVHRHKTQQIALSVVKNYVSRKKDFWA